MRLIRKMLGGFRILFVARAAVCGPLVWMRQSIEYGKRSSYRARGGAVRGAQEGMCLVTGSRASCSPSILVPYPLSGLE